MENPKNKRDRKNDLLIGVFIAVYANWLISLLDKIGSEGMVAFFIFLFSFLPFLLFFLEIFNDPDKKKRLKNYRLSSIIGVIYLIMLFVTLILSGVFVNYTIFSFFGMGIWALIIQIERLMG